MPGLAPAAALVGLLIAAPPAASTPEVAVGPLWQIAYQGTLLGVADSAVVFDHYKKETYQQELMTFDVATGQRRAALGRWRAQVRKGDMLGAPFLLGPLIGGTLYPSYAGLALIDPATDRVRLRSRPGENEYVTTLPGPSQGPIAIAGRSAGDAEIAIFGASVGRAECRVELRAVDLRSGRRLWRWAPDNGCGGLFVAVAAGRAISFSAGRLRAVHLATGLALWQQPSSICNDTTCDGLSDFLIAADDKHVAIKVEQRLAVHEASSGALLWSGKVDLPLSKRLLVSAGHVYLANHAGVLCLNANGRALWRLPLGREETPQIGVDGDILYVAQMGVVRAVDRATGTPRWAFGGDRFALASAPSASGPAATVVIGEDGKGAVAYTAHRPPGSAREMTVTGLVTVHTSASRGMPVERVTVFVGGVAVHPGADGRYEARVRLSGGRIAISAFAGCTGAVGPIHLDLDGRTTYQKDLVLDDHCGD